MRLTEEIIKNLNLTEQHIQLFNTPLKNLSKEGGIAALDLGDRVANEIWRLKDEEKVKEETLSEEERIHLNKENMSKLKRNFF